MPDSSHNSFREDVMGRGENNGIVECLRARLLAERVASKASKNEAELMAQRLEELERKMAEEIKFRNRAEKRLNYALKKLESLKVMDISSQLNVSDGSVSSWDRWKIDSGTADSSEQCGSGGEVEEMARATGSKDLVGDDSLGSWSSVGTGHSRSKEAPFGGGGDGNIDGGGELSTDLARQSPLDVDGLDNGMSLAKVHNDDALALVPVTVGPPDSSDYRPEINSKNVQDVLLALRHVKEQLQTAMGRTAAVSAPKELCSQ